MKIALASDHGGFSLKQEVLRYLKEEAKAPKGPLLGLTVEDLGSFSDDSVDYPDYAGLVAEKVSRKEVDRGILLCGTGVGMAITANKFKGVRAAAITDLFSAQMAREHNDVNVLCLGGRVVASPLAKELVAVFLKTTFAGGRHEKRVGKIKKFEDKNCK